MNLFRKKSISALLAQSEQKEASLKKELGAFDLTMLGIGAIIGTGIFVLTGVAAAGHAGPALVLSFILSGLACVFAALWGSAEIRVKMGHRLVFISML